MSMVLTKRCRVRGRIPARFVQKPKIKSVSYGRQRISPYPVLHMEADHKIDDFMVYSEPGEDEEEDLDSIAIAAAAAAEEISGSRREVGLDNSSNDLRSRPRQRGDQQQRNRLQNELRTAPSVKPFNQRCLPVSYNVTDYVLTRSIGLSRHESLHVSDEYGTRHILSTCIFREFPISLVPPDPPPPQLAQDGNGGGRRQPTIVDKVFCSQWLSYSKIIMGTKCNKLKVYDTNNHKLIDIPQLAHPSTEENLPVSPHGVYAIQLNPSRTCLATVGQYGRDVAIYRLPNLDPVCLGYKSHTDGILDLCWLDDDFVVSGGMDRQMAMWRIGDHVYRASRNRGSSCSDTGDDTDEGESLPPLPAMAPLRIKKCVGADKVRAVIFNQRDREIVALSTNAYLHVWDPERFYQKMSRKLPHAMENVCLTQRQDSSLYAVGSKSHFTLLDPRTLHHVKKVSARINGCSVKSLSFHHDILTIGTAVGAVLFYDMRAGKYMESTMTSGRAVMLKCSRGFVHQEEAALEMLPNVDYSPTLYTHCYDSSGTRLFAAGGPLSVSVRGHYAAIWR